MKSDPHPEGARLERRLSIRIAKTAATLFSRVYHHTLVRRPVRLPPAGAAILVCNHISGLDPVAIQAVCPRLIIWMMAKEYYQIKAMTWFFDLIHAIPVDRGGRDLAATRAALRALANGHVLGIFPEGKIETTRELLPFQAGVAMIAIKTGAPVYPAYIDGTQRGEQNMLRAFAVSNEMTLRFGPAVEFDRSSTGREVLDRAANAIRLAVSRLREEAFSSKNERKLI